MTPADGVRRVYDPDTLRLMSNAFDQACGFLPAQFRNSERVRARLAAHIIRQINEGEYDATRLADAAVLSLVR